MTPPDQAAERERVLLLECRLEQMRSALESARREADEARMKVAESSAREADHARRHAALLAELADARSQIAVLHAHLERSHVLRAEMQGHFFETGASGDAEELLRIRRQALASEQRVLVSERALGRLYQRVEELLGSRETLLTRFAEWQQMVRVDGPEAADLSEFVAELRREILDLEHQGLASERREARLRERLALAGIDPSEVLDEVPPHVGPQALFSTPDEGDDADGVLGAPFVADVIALDRARSALASGGDSADGMPAGMMPGDGTPADGMPENGEGAAEGAADVEETMVLGRQPDTEGRGHAAPTAPEAPPEAEAEAPPAAAGSEGVITERPGREQAPAADRTPPRDDRTAPLVRELRRAEGASLRAALLLRLGRSGDARAVDAVRPCMDAPEHEVRAAAYEALGRLLEGEPETLEPELRAGLSDEDARVRRRVVLAAAAVRGVRQRSMLEPLMNDPDAQVRRIVRQVLRHAPTHAERSDAIDEASAAADLEPAEAASTDAPDPARSMGAYS